MATRTRKEKDQASRQSSAPPAGGPLSTYRPVLDRLMFGLGVLGILVTVHLWIQQGRGFDQGCWGFNPPQGGEQIFNCEAVVTSGAGSILGISNVYWGMFYYLAVAVLGFLVMRAGGGALATMKRVRAGLVGFGFIYSMYLVNYQINSIGELCALCLTSAAIATLLFGAMLYDLITGKNAGTTHASAATLRGEPRFYMSLIAALVVLAGADLAYFNSLPEPPKPAPVPEIGVAPRPTGDVPLNCGYDPRMQPFADYRSLISDDDPIQGNRASDLVVIEYFDPNCPHCQDLHPLMKEMVATHGDSVRFHFIPFPIRDYSMPQIEVMYAAHEQGKFFEMVDAQMQMRRSTGITIPELRELAEGLGMDLERMDARLRAGTFRRHIIDQRANAQRTGMSSVPTVMVNGRFIGPRSAGCFDQYLKDARAAL